MVLNEKVPVVKMIPFISRLHTTHIEAAEGRGAGCHGDPPLPSPMDLESDCIKEIACPISIFCK